MRLRSMGSRSALIALLGLTLLATKAEAGYVEISATGNYRISKISDDNYQELTSYTGSISYYFWEMSALELSYTEGQQFVSVMPQEGDQTKITTLFSLAGLDLVLTFAGKQSAIQPYIKLGGAYVKKEIYQETTLGGRRKVDSAPGTVPSAGLGLKIRITGNLGLKMGADAWSSPPSKGEVTWDYAGRAGISWMF